MSENGAPEARDPYEPPSGGEGEPEEGKIDIIPHEGKLYVRFPKPVRVAEFTEEEAKALGGTIINVANKLDAPPEAESGAESGEES